jgi:hypothetical protein
MDEERFGARAPAAQPVADDDDRASGEAIQACVQRLSRPGPGGRRVIERAAIMAEGATAAAILDWLDAAAWRPEDPPADATAGGSGLHGLRRESRRAQPPRRYVSPPPPPPAAPVWEGGP